MVETKFHKLIKLREKLRKAQQIQYPKERADAMELILEKLIQIELDDAKSRTAF